jgi:hypothetical protein
MPSAFLNYLKAYCVGTIDPSVSDARTRLARFARDRGPTTAKHFYSGLKIVDDNAYVINAELAMLSRLRHHFGRLVLPKLDSLAAEANFSQFVRTMHFRSTQDFDKPVLGLINVGAVDVHVIESTIKVAISHRPTPSC